MNFTYDTRPSGSGGGGGSGTVTEVDTGTGLTGGPITVTGTIAFANIESGDLLANIAGMDAPPIPNKLSDIFDNVFNDEQGTILYRDDTEWYYLKAGDTGQALITGGSAANPMWGDVSSFYSTFDICVTVLGGDDDNAGTPLFPVATIDQALVLAGTPSSYINIRILDSETYTGTWNVTGMINVIGPTATLTQTDGSDCLVFETSGIQHLVNVGAIINTEGGAPIANTGTSNVVVQGAALVGPTRTASGSIFVSTTEVVGDIESIGEGFIHYLTTFRSGSDGANVIGWCPPNESAYKAYVSQYKGNDSNNGSFTNQFQTIGAAYASLEGVGQAAQVVITDSANYFENLVFDNGLISLIGPQATVTQGGDADTINCTFSGSSIQIILAGLNNFTDNNALNCSGENTVSLQVGSIEAGLVTQGSDGIISIQALSLDCDMVCTGTGTINYVSAERTGTDTPGSGQINGLYPNMPLPNIGSDTILSNITGSATPPTGNTLSDILDALIDNTQGSLLYRNDTGWVSLEPGDDGQTLTTHGPSANPTWETSSTLTSAYGIVATDQGWAAAGATFPATGVPAVSPWTSSSNLDTGNFDAFYFVGPDVASSSFSMARDYGTQDAGIYKIAFSTFQGPSRPIITVTETNTSLAIGTFDTYYPGDTATVGNVEMYFVWGGGDMNLQFACPTNNEDSTGYDFTLVGIIELSQVGLNSITSASLPFNGSQIYFSQTNGNDGNSGSYTNQLATLGAALTLQASNPNAQIICTDNATYDESVTFGSNVNLYAPTASFSSSTSDTFTLDGSGIVITASVIQSTAGLAVNNVSGYPIITLNASFSGDWVNNAAGTTVTIRAQIIFGNISNPGSGSNTILDMDQQVGTIDAQTFAPWSNSLPPFGASEAFNAVVPWTAWQYFSSNGTPVFQNYWGATNAENADVAPAQASWGTATVCVPLAGTYKFSFSYTSYTGCGIATFIINGVTTNVDMYSAAASSNSYAWTQTLVAGNNNIDLNTLTQNVLSSGYDMQCLTDGLLVSFVSSP